MYEFDSLTIKGYQDLEVHNEYLRLKSESKKTAIVFPGGNYTTQAPLLYYTALMLLEKGFNVLKVNYDYSRNRDYNRLERDDQLKWLYTDAFAAYNAVLEEVDADVRILVGKSLGTIAISHLLDEFPELRECKVIWHTPLILYTEIQRVIKDYKPSSLFVIGTKDPHYNREVLSDLVKVTQGDEVIVENANHGMEIPGSTLEQIDAIRGIASKIGEFVEE